MSQQPAALEVTAEFVGYVDIYNPPAFRFRLNPNSAVRTLAHLKGDDADRVAATLEHGHNYTVRITKGDGYGQWWAELV